MKRKKACKHTTLEEFAMLFCLAFLTTATKIKAVSNLPLEGTGTGLTNPFPPPPHFEIE